MTAWTKRNIVEVDFDLSEEDIELYEKDHFAFTMKVAEELKKIKGSKFIDGCTIKKPEIKTFESIRFGKVSAYWCGRDIDLYSKNKEVSASSRARATTSSMSYT